MTLVDELRRLVEQKDSAPTKAGIQRILDRRIDALMVELLKRDD